MGALNIPANSIPQPIQLTFEHDTQMVDGTCVLWQDSGIDDGTGKQEHTENGRQQFSFLKRLILIGSYYAFRSLEH